MEIDKIDPRQGYEGLGLPMADGSEGAPRSSPLRLGESEVAIGIGGAVGNHKGKVFGKKVNFFLKKWRHRRRDLRKKRFRGK